MNGSLWTFVLVTITGLPVTGLVSAADAPNSFAERYGAIVDNNIFIRERGRRTGPSTGGPSTRPTRPAMTPERSLMLTGIVFEEGEYRAYFESLTGGAPLRVLTGDPIAQGTVADIALNAVAYRAPDGSIQWVEIGQDLTGATTSASSRNVSAPSAATTATSDTAASTESSGDVDPSTLSVRERMMRQRQEALKRN